jgi:predicted O-methyltransferase YrrM
VDASAADDVLSEVRHLTAAEDEVQQTVRARAEAVAHVPAPEVGGLLRWAATTVVARNVVEIGAAAGITGLWLLAGMEHRGVLTSVEPDPHHHGLAATAYSDAGAAERVRSILGDPTAVLPRLSDAGYQLCLIQGEPSDYPTYLEHACRLLEPGGILVARGVLRGGTPAAEALARFHQQLAEDERLVTAVLPLDGGIALATLRSV